MQGNFLTVYLPTGFFVCVCRQVILEQTWPTCVAKQHWVPSEVFHWNRWNTSVPSRYFVYICPVQVFCVHPPWARYFVYIHPEQVFCVHPPWARNFVYIFPKQVFCEPGWPGGWGEGTFLLGNLLLVATSIVLVNPGKVGGGGGV